MSDANDFSARDGHWRGFLAVASALLWTVSACSGTTPGPHEETDDSAQSSEASENLSRWNAEDSELPGKPIPGKKARIKEGIHIRPGIDFAELTVRESNQNIEIVETNDEKRAFVTGSARQKLRGKGRKDVLMGDGFIYQLEGRPVETARGLMVQLREFKLLSVIWGDFKLDYPEDFTVPRKQNQGEKMEPIPPYRSVRQAINLPWVKFNIDDIILPFIDEARVELSGTFQLGLEGPDVEGTFEGRIPLVAEDYDCESPQYFKAGCLWGHCVVNKRYCVEKVKVTGTIGANPDLDMSASFGLASTWDIPEEPDRDFIHIIEPRDLGEVTIPSSPISIGAEFLTGYRAFLKLYAAVTMSFGVEAGFEVTSGVLYEDGGVEPIADITIDEPDGNLDFGEKYQVLLRHVVESGLRWTVQPTGTGSISNIEFELETVRTTLEARWDSIYTYHPVSEMTANKDGNGVPPEVAGSCLRTKLVVSPLIVPEFAIDIGLSVAGYELGDKWNLIDTTDDGGDALQWRPYQWPVASVDGDGEYCLTDEEREDRCGGECDPIDIPEPGDDGGPTVEPSFKVEASWKSDTDVDLEVRTPDGTHFAPDGTRSAGDGEYPHDVCDSDEIPCAGGGAPNAESVVYNPASSAPDGAYMVKVTNENGKNRADVDLIMRTQNETFDSDEVTLSASSGATSGWIQLTK